MIKILEGVPPIRNEKFESYWMMSHRLVSILLLFFESLRYV